MDNKTLDFLDELKRKSSQPTQPGFQDQDLNVNKTATPGQRVINAVTSLPQAIMKSGENILTENLSKLTALGNVIPAFFYELENNSEVKAKINGVRPDGTTIDDPMWSAEGTKSALGGIGQAAMGALNNAERVRDSKSFSDIANNAVSGVQVLRSLPGTLGEDFRQTDRGSTVATAILGFGLEVALDPSGAIGKLAKGGANLATKGAVAAGKMSPKAADVTARMASTAATGNYIAGGVSMGIRETRDALQKKLVSVASGNDLRKAKSAATALEYLYGPLSMARDEFKPLANQLMSLKQEMPRFMERSAGTAAVAVSTLPARSRTQAKELFAIVASHPRTADESIEAVDQLRKLGVEQDYINEVGSQFFDANRKMISLLDEGRGVIAGMDDVRFDVEHLKEGYYINADRRSRANWLTYAERRNNPGAWLIHNTGIKQQLESRLGIAGARLGATNGVLAENAGKIDLKSSAAQRMADLTGKSDMTPGPVTKKGQSPLGSMGEYGLDLPKNDVGLPGKMTANQIRQSEAKIKGIDTAIETIDDKLEKLSPGGRISATSGGALSKMQLGLIERKNALLAQRDHVESQLLNTNELSGDIGVNASRAGVLAEKTTASFTPAPANEMIGATLDAGWNPITKGKAPKIIPAEDAFTPQQRADFVEGLIQFANKAQPASDQFPKVFRYNPDGSPVIEFEKAVKAPARQQTLGDIVAWTDNYLDNLPITPSKAVRTELHAAVNEALAYVPGDKEFVRGLRKEKDILRDAGKMRQFLIDAEIFSAPGPNTAVISEPYVAEIFKPLLGPIKEFNARAAIQASDQSALAADVHIYAEMKKRGLVKTAQEISELPEGERGMWESMDHIYKEKGLFAHRMDISTMEAIERNLSAEVPGIPVAAQLASSLFKRNALLYNPASHATQWLGNITMLKMSGYDEMFTNTPKFAKQLRRAHTAILSSDELFEDAVRNGVTVSSTVLDGATKQSVLRNYLTQPKTDDMKATVGNIMNSLHSAVANNGAAGIKLASDAQRVVGADTGAAVANASQKLSPGAMYSMSDQLLRMYVYQHEVEKGVQKLVAANPALKGWLKKNSPLLDIDSLDAYHTSGTGKTAPIFKPEEYDAIKAAYASLRENAANVANDVGLNMADTPRAVTYLSRSGIIPFMNFQTKAVGRNLKWMDETPWVYTPFATAQRNGNQAFNENPESFEADVAALPANVRASLVIPTGENNSQGYPMYQDLSRFVPFGMFMGSSQEYGTDKVQQPNSLISIPFADLLVKATTGEGRQEGQSFSAFLAGTLAQTFGPSGVGPGSYQMDALARSIERTTFAVDPEGNVVPREPSAVEKAIVSYNSIPEQVGEAFDYEDTGTAMGNPAANVAARNRTTPEVAKLRIGVPGYGYASDKELTVVEHSKRADSAIRQLEQQINSYRNRVDLTAEDGARITQLQERIVQIQLQKTQQINKLQLGE